MMFFNFDNEVLPQSYFRNGKECYLDPIRKKLIYITPEETVRQKTISFLINRLKVPSEMISVEERLSHYGLKTNKRADIIIHKAVSSDGLISPLAVIECKAPNVYIDEKSIRQATEYCDDLMCDYFFVLNGFEWVGGIYNSDENRYMDLKEVPTYPEMINGKYIPYEKDEYPQRIPFEQLEENLSSQDYYISSQTPVEKALPVFNLFECLLDIRVKMPTGKYKIFTLLEDYGVRMLTYGNSSGGSFFGPYRSFLIDYNGNTEFVSISVSTYWKSGHEDNVKTCICVAIDNEKESHHALQLVVEENLVVEKNKIKFYHHGKIAIGNMGSGKIDEMRCFVEDIYPEIIFKNKFFLGTLINERLWRLDDENVIKLIENLISYALVRDEYRKYVKKQKR